MTAPDQYRRGPVLRASVAGHPEPVQLVSVEKEGMCAGGGLLLIVDRGDGEIDRVINLLNSAAGSQQ